VSELVYLVVAVVVTVLGSVLAWHRHRRPHALESGVQEFARGLDALRVEAAKRGSRRSA